MNNKEISFAQAIESALEEEFASNLDTIIIGEDILDSDTRHPVIGDFKKKFPERVINHLPLVEEMLGGIALGMSLRGLKPIVQLDYSTFIPLALGDIHRTGLWRYRMFEKNGPGVLFRVGYDGYTRKGAELATSLLALPFHLPNIRIVVPSLPYYAKGLLKTALRSSEPVLFFEYKRLYPSTIGPAIPQEDYTIPFGTVATFKKGRDVTIIGWGYASILALQASQALKKYSIQAEVLAPQTLYPLDMEVLYASAKKTRCIVIVEEDMLRGGIGAEIAARISEKFPGCQIRRIGASDIPLPYARNLERSLLPNVRLIANACANMVKKKPSMLWRSLFFR